MIYRTYDTEDAQTLLLEGTVGFDNENFKEGSDHVVLTDNRNYMIFEFIKKNLYSTHILFRSRGKEALDICSEMLSWMFDNRTEALQALVPSDQKRVAWFARQMKFKELGEVETIAGPHRIFYITKGDFNV